MESLTDCLSMGAMPEQDIARAHFNRGMARIQLQDFDGALEE